jgi:hypothetical protein
MTLDVFGGMNEKSQYGRRKLVAAYRPHLREGLRVDTAKVRDSAIDLSMKGGDKFR